LPNADTATLAADNERMSLRGRVALVTGASSGIGRATAEVLASAGARVLLHGRDFDSLAGLAKRIGGVPLCVDLAEPEAADRLAAAAIGASGRVDILVANAGQGWAGPLRDMRGADVDRLLAVNLSAPIRLTQALLPAMTQRGTGYLAFVSSIAGRTGVAGEAVYAASKAGLDAFAESLRFELRGTGVRVGVLVPGVVATEFFHRRGQPYGRARPRPLAVAGVARALVGMIEAGGTEVYTPRWLRLPVAVRATLPGTYRRLAGRFGGS
jgi:short-subunit dehydrogenase